MTPAKTILYLTNFVFALVAGIISLRIILKLFGASQAAPFVRWTYETSESLLTPFLGMFPSPRLTNGVILEFSALFALLVYSLAGFLIIELIERLVYAAQQRNSSSKKRG